MKSLIIFFVAIYGLHALPTQNKLLKEWDNYKAIHGKQYANIEEESLKKEIFLKNWQYVKEHNKKFEMGLVSYKIGINKFSDMTEEEKRPYTHGLIVPPKKIQSNSTFKPSKNYRIPYSKDWRDDGAILPIKDQGRCGSCWAFSANGALEPHYYIHKNLKVSLSEQQLVDCVTDNFGCGGGWMDTAYQYIQENGGINSDNDYPYEAIDNQCRYDENKSHYTIAGFVDLESGNEQDLAAAIAEKGPVAITFDATGDFSFYQSGVYYNPDCSTDIPAHAAVVIGYGTEKGQDYWLVRNSWGAEWGDHGYFKTARNRNNHCGIASTASYPIVL